MKKIKTINFLSQYNPLGKYNNITKILLSFMILFLVAKLLIGINSVKKLEQYLNNNNSVTYDKDDTVSHVPINFNEICNIYNLIGYENIRKFSVKGSDVEIDGNCNTANDINVIKKRKGIKNFSINSIKKDKEKYIFKLKFQMRSIK